MTFNYDGLPQVDNDVSHSPAGAALQDLALRHDVLEVKLFSQEAFRSKHGVSPTVGLCAGLVQAWWSSVRCGEDGIAVLEDCTPTIVRSVLAQQLRSAYFEKIPSETAIDPETDYWLRIKYGRRSLQELRSLCVHHQVANLLELDLVLQYQSIIVERHIFPAFSAQLLGAFSESIEPGLRLLLLRYSHPGRRGGQCGHRVGLHLDKQGVAKLFDPNHGEVTFRSIQQFQSWFLEFWRVCEYRPRLEESVANSPPFRLYRLRQTGKMRPPRSRGDES